ncbi:hypothetical protein A2397_04415 [Candidatus Amesbacteria bacterium RIFOXYB1_FULL_44_23]|uniref:ATP synthase subunit b n=1 Tax=Candidatus Amesbacteria bacterium RIFOXYB1_FULL_44_23 TaxID=1797263 RepID=A0A1F4ZSU2_9BACT|nr:MAG: hypothetical protein A2397_04415 [Candidatus Amesbacteria bacterium RIFOXYB1_FULL_44_23]
MEELGINPVLLVAQIISFGLLFVIFKKFLFGKIQESLAERRQAVEKMFEGKAEMEKKLQEFEAEREKRKAADEVEAKKLLAESKKEAAIKRSEIVDLANKEAELARMRGMERLKHETEEAEGKLKGKMAGLATNLAKEMIATSAKDAKWQREVIKASLLAAKKAESAK